MNSSVDARGLSCPQPVLMGLGEMKKVRKGEIVVLVDTDTSKENVIRAATGQGWDIRSVDVEGETYSITMVKG
jgi:tRNA 2-thiouridine synthesizing protein A